MASFVVKFVAQQLGSLLVDEVKRLYNVKGKIENLIRELEGMRCFLIDAESLQHQDMRTRQRVSEIRDLAYEIEDMFDTYLLEPPLQRQDGIRNTLKWFSCLLCTCDVALLHDLGSNIDEVTEKIKHHTSMMERYDIKNINPTAGSMVDINDVRQTYAHTVDVVVGLTKDVEEVMDQMINKQVNVVGICGTGGLGKTTLARKLFSHEPIKQHFGVTNFVWVYVSRQVDKIRIFQDILFGLNTDEGSRNQIKGLRDAELPGKISEILKERKCLVVLDDIWTVDAWNILKPAFSSIGTNSASKILLTTRDHRVLQSVDFCRFYSHPLEPLSLDDSMKLLQLKAFQSARIAGSDVANTTTEMVVGSGSFGGVGSGPNRRTISEEDVFSDAVADFGDESSVSDYDNVIEPAEMQDIYQDDRVANAVADANQVEFESEMVDLGWKMLKHCQGLPIAIVALGGILSTRKTLHEWQDVERNIASYLLGDKQQEGRNDRILEVLELSYHDLPYYLKPCFLYLGHFPEDYKISTQRLYHLWEAEGFLVEEGEAKNRGTSYDIGERYLHELVQRSMVQVGECWRNGKIKTCRVHDILRDVCLRKCKETSFLSVIEDSEPYTTSTSPTVSDGIKKWRRCALHYQNGDFDDKYFEQGEKAIGLRSLLVFRYQEISQKIWKSFPHLRVLDLQGNALQSMDGVEHLIYLRYLSLREVKVEVLPSSVLDLKYLETLDIRSSSHIKIPNKFHKLERLKHLYLPSYVEVIGNVKLTFPACQMETIKNFDSERCETKDLLEMKNLRVFSIKRVCEFGNKGDVKNVLAAPVMKNPGQLINSFRLEIEGDVIKEDPTILSSAARHPCFNELILWGPVSLKDGNSRITFPNKLTRLGLHYCEMGKEDVLALEKLPHLKFLRVFGSTLSVAPDKLSFSDGCFLYLTVLHLQWLHELEEWEVGKGALPNLQFLEIENCGELKKLKNIPNSLTRVELYGCDIGKGSFLLLALEELPRLQVLDIRYPIIQGGSNKVSFSPRGFPKLTELLISLPDGSNEWELEVGDEAFVNLRRLMIYHSDRLKEAPKGIPDSVHIDMH